MSSESSAITRRLSNWRSLFLNNCLYYGQHLLPQRCLLCAAPAAADPLCVDCYTCLPWLTAMRCPQCALPTEGGCLCGACLSHPPRFDRVSAAFVYRWPLAQLIHAYKYGGNLALGHLLAQAMCRRLAGGVNLIIPMPLSPRRLRSRGFNQALEIARVASRLTGAPLAAHACRRVRDGMPQAALPWKERTTNIRDAFVCDADLSGRRVAIVDDVMTTGATLNELARNLLRAGAVEIQCWIVARAIKQTQVSARKPRV